MADTTGRIPLWIIGTVTGILVIGIYFPGEMIRYPDTMES